MHVGVSWFVSVSAILFGLLAYTQLPVNDLPAVDYPVIQVTCGYPGANPDTMASTSTFLVDGLVAGAWRFDAGRVKLEPFEPLGRAVSKALDEEAERLAHLHR